MIAVGVFVHELLGFFGSVRVRYFGPRPLIEDDSVRSAGSALANLQAGYRFDATWTITMDILNLFDSKLSDQEYYYTSRLRGEPENPANTRASGGDGGYLDRMAHPAEPFALRLALSARF